MYNERNMRPVSSARRQGVSGTCNRDLSPDMLSRRMAAGSGVPVSAQNTRRNPGANKGDNGWGLREHPLGMVYSPYQEWRNIYKEETALSRGTIFSELDLPFEGKNCKGGTR